MKTRGILRRWWLDRSVRVKGLCVVAVPLAALAVTVAVSLVVGSAERHERAAARAAFALTSAAGRVLADALNAETGVRGYAATRNPGFLAPYRLALTRIGADEQALRKTAAAEGEGRPGQEVNATAARVFLGLARLRAAASSGAPARRLVPDLTAGKTSMDELREQVADLTRRPAAVTAAGAGRISHLETTSEILSVSGLVLGVLAGLAGVALFTSGISRRVAAAAANAARLGEGQPLQPADHSGDDIGRLSCALARAEQLLSHRAAELTAARDQAVQATQAKTAFLTATSHELRTPLNSILGFTQLLTMSSLGTEDRDSAQRILAAGRHLLTLINDLIDIARIESGELSLSLEPVAVYPLGEEAVQLIGPLAAQREITVTAGCPHPGLAVYADRQRLSQVLVNLLSNAVKYNCHGGAIALTCQPDDPGQVQLTVADTGPGLTGEELERIFVPFERLEAGQTGTEGSGIGLPLARALTEAMAGQLTVASTPGHGSAFTITLPRAPDITHGAPPIPEPAQRPQPGPPAGRVLDVLYVEDNPDNIEVVSRFLAGRLGTRVHAVTSGQEGIDHARQHRPDVVLLDLHVPGISGEQVLRELRAHPATGDIPVAILSADASPGVIRRLMVAGARAYLTKPINLSELGGLLQTLTGSPGGAPPAQATAAAAGPPAPEQPSHTVLYIEDDPSNTRLVQRILARRPHTRLITAHTARDGLESAATDHPDLILLDNRLPDATGSQVLHQLTTTQTTAGIPVIIISGDSGKDTTASLLSGGAAGFLPKPFDIPQLLATIDQHLA